MSHTRDQVNILLKRADELRARGVQTERKLFEMLEEIARLTARGREKNRDADLSSAAWQSAPINPATPDTHK
jgi:hypothetical protein